MIGALLLFGLMAAAAALDEWRQGAAPRREGAP